MSDAPLSRHVAGSEEITICSADPHELVHTLLTDAARPASKPASCDRKISGHLNGTVR